jgi:hypothetical protein
MLSRFILQNYSILYVLALEPVNGLLFFSAIGVSEYQISDWRILETIGLPDIGSRPQSIRLSVEYQTLIKLFVALL